MSVCSDFAEHVWKPGSCKNCFHPSSAHLSNSNLVCARSSKDADEDNCLNTSSSYSKPTIAVKPTMMNHNMSDMWTDVSMNTEQDNQTSTINKLSLKDMLDLAPLYADRNGCQDHNIFKEALLQNTASSRLDYPNRFSPGAVSPSGHQAISRISVTQDEGQESVSLKESGSSNGYRTQVIKPVKSNNLTHSPVERLRRTFSSGGCDRHREVEEPTGQGQQASQEIGRNIATDATGSTASCCHTEPLSVSNFSSFTPHGRMPGPLGQHCGHVSSLAEPTRQSDCCPCHSSTGSVRELKGFTFLQNLPAGSMNGPLDAEPIYAESTKRKKKTCGEKSFQQGSNYEGELAGESQGTKILTQKAADAGDTSRWFLKSSGAPLRTLCPHSSEDLSCPTPMWYCSSSETNTASHQIKPQLSPPVPPKTSFCSSKSVTSCHSPASHPEGQAYPGVTTPSTSPTENKALGEGHNSIPTVSGPEHRPTLQYAWNQGGQVKQGGGQDAVPQHGVPRLINETAVLEPKDWRSALHSKERTLPGTAHKGISQPGMGGAAQKDRHKGTTLANGTSSSVALSEEKTESGDPTPPPPPPKKHHRASSKMSKVGSDLEKVSWKGSVESLAQSLRTLTSNFTPESLSSSPKIFADAGPQDVPHLCLRWFPVSSHPNPLPGYTLQPPPLPEKKMVNRTSSGPNSEGGRQVPTANPCFSSSRSEGNICGPDQAQQSGPATVVNQQNAHSTRNSSEHFQVSLHRPPRSHTFEEPLGPGCHVRRTVPTSSSSPQLCTPGPGFGLQLHALLSNMDSREGVYSKLGGLYAESLRRLALKCEDHFTRSQRNPLRFDEGTWSLFKLSCNSPCCDAGDAIYYSASCASDPCGSYAIKICKNQTQDAKQGHLYGLSVQHSVPPHFNLQQDCGHFIACIPQSMLPLDKAEGSAGQTEEEHVVVITREVPHQSAADFVREWEAFHRVEPEAYERRVCFLLLQLCNGLEHLKEHGVTHRDLCLENLLLVPQGHPLAEDQEQRHVPRLLISSFAKAKQHCAEDPVADPVLKSDCSRLAPEILSATQYRKFDEFQTGILIYELLHQPNPFEVSSKLKEPEYGGEDLPPIPRLSLYSAGLQRLAHLLLQPDPVQRIHIQEAKRCLQSLLWGPREDMMAQHRARPGEGSRHEGLLNWLDVKRALLMMKFAERSLEPEQSAELEDWLCCLYFSSANPASLCHAADLLYFK